VDIAAAAAARNLTIDAYGLAFASLFDKHK